MLREWLAPTPVAAFVASHLGKQPWARPGAAAAAVPLFDWTALDRVLGAEEGAEILVVAGGQLLALPAPRSLAEARALLAAGVGLALRRTERADPAIAAFAAAFADELPGEVHVQAFVTPGGTHGFGWHFDDEDVFIAHTAGIKDYYFRPNTVVDRGAGACAREFQRYRRETSPLGAARLIAGDCLYLPARWWHMARCVEDSLSISLGIYPRF
jgi:50S ribosomal protein L16 3-hydroxylase